MLFGKLFSKKRKKSTQDEHGIIVQENALSSKMEGYNRLRDNILYINSDGNNKVLQIESAVAHEGKTTIACNLAVSLGIIDKKVIVVDLDFRRPRVHHKFEMENKNGIADYMLGNLDKKDLIKQTKYKNVDIIPRGSKVYNAPLILIAEKFKELIKELREQYDFVLLDCAPVLQVSDFINILQVSDGVVLLVAYGSTTRNQVQDTVKEINKNGGKIIGTVFSMYDKNKAKGYGYHSKSYYGRGYYNYYVSNAEEEAEEAQIKAEQAQPIAVEDTKVEQESHPTDIQ